MTHIDATRSVEDRNH